MCDLPEYEGEVQRYVTDRIAFEHTSCYEGLLTFTFGFRVADVFVQAYQDFEHEWGERVEIPIDPSGEFLDGMLKEREVREMLSDPTS